MTLGGRVALVTGATRGIGRAVAKEFAHRGARLLLTGRSAEGLAEVAAGLGEAATVALDLTVAGTPDAPVEAALARWGQLSVLVNNAGFLIPRAAIQCRDEDWERTFALNVTAVFKLSRAPVRVMRGQGGGTIVDVASDWPLVGARARWPMPPQRAQAQITRGADVAQAGGHVLAHAHVRVKGVGLEDHGGGHSSLC